MHAGGWLELTADALAKAGRLDSSPKPKGLEEGCRTSAGMRDCRHRMTARCSDSEIRSTLAALGRRCSMGRWTGARMMAPEGEGDHLPFGKCTRLAPSSVPGMHDRARSKRNTCHANKQLPARAGNYDSAPARPRRRCSSQPDPSQQPVPQPMRCGVSIVAASVVLAVRWA